MATFSWQVIILPGSAKKDATYTPYLLRLLECLQNVQRCTFHLLRSYSASSSFLRLRFHWAEWLFVATRGSCACKWALGRSWGLGEVRFNLSAGALSKLLSRGLWEVIPIALTANFWCVRTNYAPRPLVRGSFGVLANACVVTGVTCIACCCVPSAAVLLVPPQDVLPAPTRCYPYNWSTTSIILMILKI